MDKIKNEDVSELKEKLVRIIKCVMHKCEHGNCSNCKFVGMSNCDYRQIIDVILDNFIVAEKLRYEDVDEPKEELNSIPKLISDVIFVEDGSVDTDELKKQFGDNVPVIVYRQGGARPEIRHLACPITPEFLKKEVESK